MANENYLAAQQSTNARAEYQHEKQAREWASAKARLMDALETSNRASAELQEAQKLEQEHWDALVGLAGRGIPTPLNPPPSVGGYLPRR